jgi:phage terminase large subunit-like protein
MIKAIIIEKAANREAALSTLRRSIPGIIGVKPIGSKVARVASTTTAFEAG